MSSPFLSNNTIDFSSLQDGSTEIFASTLGAANFTPGFPVKINNDQILYPTLLDVSDISGLPSTIGDVISDSSSAVINNIATFNTVNGLHIKDSGVSIGSFGNVTSDSLSSIVGDVVTYNSVNGLHIYDSGTLLSNLATTSQLNSYMPLAGGTFSGPVQMGSNVLTVNHMSTTGLTGQVWGNSSSGSTAGSIVIGDSSTGVGDVCIIGHNSFNTSTSDQSTLIGINNTAAAGATQGICLGFDNFCENNGGQICIGALNTAQGLNSVCIGSGLVNSIANSILIGATGQNLVNIRPLTNGTCDLGATSGNYFNNAYLSGNLAGNTFSRAVDNIVSNSGGSTGSNIAFFGDTSGIHLIDLGISSSSISGGPFLPLNGSTGMSGNLQMNNNGITGIGTMTVISDIKIDSSLGSNILIGQGATTSSTGVVCIGGGSSVSGFQGTVIGPVASSGAGSFSTAVGRNATATGGGDVALGNQSNSSAGSGVAIGSQSQCAGTNSVSLGRAANCTNAGTQQVAIGFQATNSASSAIAVGVSSNASAASAIAIGASSAASATNAIALGPSASNSVTNSCLIGNSSITNIRPNNNSICNLGATGSNFNSAFITGNLVGNTFSRAVDNIVSNSGGSTGSNVVFFGDTSGIHLTDLGIPLSSISGGPFLPLAGGTMSGVIDMNNNEIHGIAALRPQSTSTIIGIGATATGGPNSVVIGNNASVSVASQNGNVLIGASTSTTADNCVLIGRGATAAGTSNICIGALATSTGSGTTNVVIGPSSKSSGISSVVIGFSASAINSGIAIGTGTISSANDAYAIGSGASNSTANSLLLGNNTIANIRPNNDNTCDLGTTSNRYKNLYLAGILDNTATVSIGTSSATALSIGKSGITTTVSGDLAVTNSPYGAWYCTTSYTPSFTAGTAKLTPPATVSSGSLNLFTHSLGVLTYTGTRTRIFRIEYMVSLTSGATSNFNLTLFNSTNGSTAISSTQTSIQTRIIAAAGNPDPSMTFSDIITLNTNDTVQLAGLSSATESNLAYSLVMCNITGLLN